MKRVVDFDDRLHGSHGGRYRVEVYRQRATDAARVDPAKYQPELIYSYELKPDRDS
jgi:hypothetical protein